MRAAAAAYLAMALAAAAVGAAFFLVGPVWGLVAAICFPALMSAAAVAVALVVTLCGLEIESGEPEDDGPETPEVEAYTADELAIERLGDPLGVFAGEPFHERIRATPAGGPPLELEYRQTVRRGEVVPRPEGRWLILPPGLLYAEPVDPNPK